MIRSSVTSYDDRVHNQIIFWITREQNQIIWPILVLSAFISPIFPWKYSFFKIHSYYRVTLFWLVWISICSWSSYVLLLSPSKERQFCFGWEIFDSGGCWRKTDFFRGRQIIGQLPLGRHKSQHLSWSLPGGLIKIFPQLICNLKKL